ncbi:hypothetical protein BDR06DRAFT_860477, partial [Suillus hirtellus]
KAFDTLSQITSYAATQLATQYHTHTFSILIIHNRAHLIRWDREGDIVTNAFNYLHEPYLANFFYHF